MEPLAGVEPAPGRKGAAQDTTPPRPQTSYRECNTGLDTLLLCLSYSGIKIARVLTGQWVLLAARTDAAVQHPCRCFEKEILCATQKPQGGFPFLTAFDDSIIAWNFGFLVSFFFVYLI